MVHGLERPSHVECKVLAASAALSSHFYVLRSFQSLHHEHESGKGGITLCNLLHRTCLIGLNHKCNYPIGLNFQTVMQSPNE